MINVIKQRFLDQRLGVLYYIIGLSAYSLLLVAMFPSLAKMDLEGYLSQMPEAFLKFFNATGSLEAYSTLEGFLTMEFLSSFFILIVSFYLASAAGSVVAGGIEKRTLDFQLSQPVSRIKYLFGEVVVILAYTFVLVAVTVFSIWLFALVYNIDTNVGGLIRFALMATVFLWSIGGFALFLSSWLSSKIAVVAATLGFVIASFVFFSLTKIIEKLDDYDKLSLFYLYRPEDLLKGNINWDYAGIAILIFVAFTSLSAVIFNRRDL